MEFSIKKLAPETAKAGCIVVGVHQAGELTQPARAVDQASKGAVRAALSDLSGKTGSTLLLRGLPGVAAERVLLVGLGEHKEFAEAAFRDAVRAAAAALKELGAKDAALFLADLKVGSRPSAWNVRHAVLATREAFYRFDELKTQKKSPDPALGSVILPFSPNSQLEQALTEAAATADGAALARKLGNLPANLCTPTYLAEEAKKIARQFKLGIDVLERRDMEKLGMGALLSVAKASHQPPKLIVLRYSGAAKGRKPVVLVGKGITFDTGGISIKPADGMEKMKYDMAGGATMLGVMRALAALKPSVKVICVVPSTENMPGGKAQKPGDIQTAMSGKTIEVLNTDAEGRLILADGIHYAKQLGATHLVDAATLTGAIVVALANINVGVFGSDQAFTDKLLASSKAAGEKMWQMPIDDDYRDFIKGTVADIQNISSGKGGGAITGAMFIKEFTGDTPWIHLDIAGTAWNDDAKPWLAKGPTGVALRTLVHLVMSS